MKHSRRFVRIALCLAAAWITPGISARACIWDSDRLSDEKRAHPKMAEVILAPSPEQPDVVALRERITRLQAHPRGNDPAWWNDLGGAHLRLGQPAEAARLLEPVVRRFPGDYGLHANLGTAYHLLGRYPEAEKEIRRDLEINPQAHFGLERYHLALLQYLARDPEYRKRHVYVDEWSEAFWRAGVRVQSPANHEEAEAVAPSSASDLKKLERAVNEPSSPYDKSDAEEQLLLARVKHDPPPPYRSRWDLAADPKFEEGILYMASLNREQPACFVMLGLASHYEGDLNLAATAYQRAIDLGSPQSEHLASLVKEIRDHVQTARDQERGKHLYLVLSWLCVLLPVAGLTAWLFRRFRPSSRVRPS